MPAQADRVSTEASSFTFYLFEKHKAALKQLAKEREVAGRQPSVSQLISEALDGFLRELGKID
ncbi:MAG: hypothetical protein FVQ81_02010 [Candidatus Glassbacteria bacterium]|nr:hypothetical protein [Candidatus Glassbacteria bacterium]